MLLGYLVGQCMKASKGKANPGKNERDNSCKAWLSTEKSDITKEDRICGPLFVLI